MKNDAHVVHEMTEGYRRALIEALQATCEEGEKLGPSFPNELQKAECAYQTKYLKQVLNAVLADESLHDLHFDFGKERKFNWNRESGAPYQTEILKSPYAVKDVFNETIQRTFYMRNITSVQEFGKTTLEEVEAVYQVLKGSSSDGVIPFLIRRLHENLQKFHKEFVRTTPLRLAA